MSNLLNRKIDQILEEEENEIEKKNIQSHIATNKLNELYAAPDSSDVIYYDNTLLI